MPRPQGLWHHRRDAHLYLWRAALTLVFVFMLFTSLCVISRKRSTTFRSSDNDQQTRRDLPLTEFRCALDKETAEDAFCTNRYSREGRGGLGRV